MLCLLWRVYKAQSWIVLLFTKHFCSDCDQLNSLQSVMHCSSLLSLSKLKYWAIPVVEAATFDILHTSYQSSRFRFVQVSIASFKHLDAPITVTRIKTRLRYFFVFKARRDNLFWYCSVKWASCISFCWHSWMSWDIGWQANPKCLKRNLHCHEPGSSQWECGE